MISISPAACLSESGPEEGLRIYGVRLLRVALPATDAAGKPDHVRLNLFGLIRAARRSFPRFNSFQEPMRGLSKCFQVLLSVVAHGGNVVRKVSSCPNQRSADQYQSRATR